MQKPAPVNKGKSVVAAAKPIVPPKPAAAAAKVKDVKTALPAKSTSCSASDKRFLPLLKALQELKSEGKEKPHQSQVAAIVFSKNSKLIESGGKDFSKWGQYATLAVQANVVRVGRGEKTGSEWISLA